MTLTEIEYGSLASSAVLNSNFQFLQDKITELSAQITSETSSFSSSVATLNNSITELLGYRNSFIPVGTIIISQTTQIPTGFLLCDGSSLLRTQYEDLFAAIGTLYGASDSNHFSLPNLTNKTVWGSSSANNVGKVMNPGLPNITGSFNCLNNSQYWENGLSGAYYDNDRITGHNIGSGGTTVNIRNIGFSANRSNNIYGASSTVQPPAVVTHFCIKY